MTDGEFSWCSSSKNAIKLAIYYCLHMWLLCVFFWILWKIKAKLIFSCYRFFLTFCSTSWRFSFFPHINWLAYPWDIDKMVHMCNSYHSYQSFIKSYWAKNLSCDQFFFFFLLWPRHVTTTHPLKVFLGGEPSQIV